MTIPQVIIAGDSINFTESGADYSAADGWVMTYVLVNASGKVTLASAADGVDHKFTAGSADTAAWSPGDYTAVLSVAKGGERLTLDQSAVRVTPDPIASAQLDGRSAAKKTLDALRAAYDAMVAGGGGMVQTVVINGRTTQFRTTADILQQISFFQRQVNAELASERLKKGEGLGGRILTRL